MRFYIPGTVSKKEVNGEEGSGAEEEEEEEQNAANLFYETLMDKAEIGEVAGATFATFQDILHLTPRYVSPIAGLLPGYVLLTISSEGDSISICTRTRSAYEAKRTTTRSNIRLSRSSSFYPRMMRCTPSSPWGSIHRYDRVRHGIHLS